MSTKTTTRPGSAGRETSAIRSQSKLIASSALVFGLAACASSALAQQPPAGPAPSGATPNGPAINQAQSEGSQQQPGTASKATEGSTSGSTQSGVPTGQGQPSGVSQQPDTAGTPVETKPPVPALGTAQDGTPATDTPDASAQATIRDVVVTRNEAPPPPPAPEAPPPPLPPPQVPCRTWPEPGTAVSGKVLAQEQKTTVQDFAQAVPSVEVTQPNARNVEIFIRGIGKTSTVEALENSVGVNVDGVVLTNDAMTWGEFTDIQRLDVLRGPQGFTFGKNSTLGTLVITSLPPSFTPSQDFSVTYGNRNLFFVTGSSTGTVIDNTLAYRASVYVKEQDRYS